VLLEFPAASILEQATIGLGDWKVEDVREPIFVGLVAGGLSPNDAGKLCRTWIDERGFKGLVENAELALTIILVGLDIPEDEGLGEPVAGEAPPTPTGV
jgi:hypothetical protein